MYETINATIEKVNNNYQKAIGCIQAVVANVIRATIQASLNM